MNKLFKENFDNYISVAITFSTILSVLVLTSMMRTFNLLPEIIYLVTLFIFIIYFFVGK
jgi:hypothetical protein